MVRPMKIAVVEDIVMRQRDALGRSGGAAGELDIDGIVELQRAVERCERVAVARTAHPRHVFERNRAGASRLADLDRRAQLRQPRCVQIAWCAWRVQASACSASPCSWKS